MPANRLSLRAARPTHPEGRFFAQYLDQAANGVFRTMLGRRSERILATAYLTPGHDLSYERVMFAQLDGRTVGMVSAYTATQHRQSDHHPLERAAGSRMVRAWVVTRAARPLFEFMDRVPEGDFYVQAVAVAEGHQGEGVGSVLLDHAEREAKESGSTRIALDVADTNAAARRLYERRGMCVEATSDECRWAGGLCLQRMVKTL